MKRLIEWSIDHHWMVLALSVLLAAAGAWTARHMPVDVFPDLTAPTVTVLTEGHGMAPEEMETLVTFPIETAINGASGVRRVRSATAVGIAVVWVEFDWGTDIFRARQVVTEKLALVSGAPAAAGRAAGPGARSPRSWARSSSSRSPRSSDDPLTLRTLADTMVRRRLLAVPGVSQVTPIGGAERQYPGRRAPRRAARQQRLADRAAGRGARRRAENTSAGVFAEGAQEYVLAGDRPRPDARGHRRDRGRAARRRDPVLVRDVADVRRGRRVQARRGLAQRQAGRHRRRAEAAGRQHARADRAARSRARRAPARAARGHDDRPAHLPAGGLHRGGGRQRRSTALRDGGILVVVVVVAVPGEPARRAPSR